MNPARCCLKILCFWVEAQGFSPAKGATNATGFSPGRLVTSHGPKSPRYLPFFVSVNVKIG
jgi:hypothetical protein